MKNKFFITKHLRERFCERFMFNSKDMSQYDLDKVLTNLIISSKETKAYINNSNFMENYYKRYGYNFHHMFLANTKNELGIKIIFVVKVFNGNNIIVTCFDTINPVFQV